MNQNIIFVFGFHHSGTTILRTIFGHIGGSETFLPEADPLDHPDFAREAKYRVFKNPEIKEKYFSPSHHDIVKFFIARNPLHVLSSCNRRYSNNPSVAEHTVNRYRRMAEMFVRTQNEAVPNLHHIKYEDMFLDGHRAIREALAKHDIEHDEEIFRNQLYKNFSHKDQSDKSVPKNRPSDTDHERLRFYQVNQPFQNNNDPSKVFLQPLQIKALKEDENVAKMYPEIIAELWGM
jgi:hypothetical protein